MASSTNAQDKEAPYVPPPLLPEEEDSLIHLRIVSDERALRKVIKKFHTYVFACEPGGVAYGPDDNEVAPDEAREGLLAELATFQMMLQKSALVCQAEARQVVEYEREKERIGKDHDVTRNEILKLKVLLEEAQLLRKRKIEYDQVAEKVNMLPSRADLHASIASVQEEIAAIQVERGHKARMMHARKGALDLIVTSLEALRLMDKEPEIQVLGDASAEATAGDGAGEEDQQREDREDDRRDREREREARDRDEDGEEGEEAEVARAMLNPTAKPFLPKSTFNRLHEAEGGSSAVSSAVPSVASSPIPPKPDEGEEGEEREDIEMGEVSEIAAEVQTNVNGRTKKRQKEELEEGETTPVDPPQNSSNPSHKQLLQSHMIFAPEP